MANLVLEPFTLEVIESILARYETAYIMRVKAIADCDQRTNLMAKTIMNIEARAMMTFLQEVKTQMIGEKEEVSK